MPFIDKPRSNADRLKALVAADNKWTITTDSAKRAITANWHTQLVARLPLYRTAYNALAGAVTAQARQTALAEKAAIAQGRRLSHFIQILNMAIEREEFPPETRAYYGIAVTSGSVPTFDSYADIALWTDHLVNGESARLAADPDAPAISLPSAADLTAGLATFNAARNAQSPLKDAFDAAQTALSEQNAAVDFLIDNLWADIENFFRNEPPPSLRRKAREWGVVYAYRPDEPEDPTAPTEPLDPITP